MSAIVELDQLLTSLSPVLMPDEWVFCHLPEGQALPGDLPALASFREAEGLSLIVRLDAAADAGFDTATRFRQITLQVHSSLSAVGLTAAVSAALTEAGISANVVAAFHHDHVFVPAERALEALAVLESLAAGQRRDG